MEKSKLTQLKEKLEKEGLVDNVKNEFRKGQFDFYAKLLTLLIALSGVVLAIVGAIKLSTIENIDKEAVYIHSLYYIIAYAAIFYLFFGLFTRRIYNNVSKNYSRLTDVVDVFREIEEQYENRLLELQTQIKDNLDISRNLANIPYSNLISWYDSGIREIKAKKVFGITLNLSWIANDDKLAEIFEDLKTNKEDKYFFIVVAKSQESEMNFRRVIGLIEEKTKDGEIENLESRFQVVKLHNMKVGKTEIYKNRFFPLPIPNDIVIYKEYDTDKSKKTAVISTSPVPIDRTVEDLHNHFDLKFENINQVELIENWFKEVWNQLTGNNIDGE